MSKLDITLTLAEVLAIDKACTLLENSTYKSLKTSFKISLLKSKIAPEVKIYNEEFQKLVTKYAKPIENEPGTYKWEPATYPTALKELETLSQHKVTITVQPLFIEDLEQIEPVPSAEILYKLAPVIHDYENSYKN